ncbi:MAG: hypothetical protein ACSHX7_08565 [Luteolibacter sp.]
MPKQGSHEKFWLDYASSLSRRVNTAWFFQTLSAPLLITAVVGSVAAIFIRREFPGITPALLACALASLIVVVTIICLIVSRRKFESATQSIVRIEAKSGLNSSLSTASAGAAMWPKPPENLHIPLKWHLPKTLIPPAIALVLLALGLLLPIPAKTLVSNDPSRQPQAWSQLDSQLEQLSDDGAVDEEYIDDMKERLEQLRAQEEEDWFSHASLEATDSLKESQNSEIENLDQNLDDAENALEALSNNAQNLNEGQKQKLTEEFEEALEGLQNGAMKPNPALLDQLSELDPNNLGKLSPEQLSKLKENMEKLQQSLDGVKQEGSEGDWTDQLLGDNGEGGGQGEGEGEEGEGGSGSGGIQRGPGHDPNLLKDEKNTLDVGELTALEAEDLSRAIPGDLLQLQDGKHTVDETASRATAGGNAARGKGGDRVWKDSLAPDEQKALKKYFE